MVNPPALDESGRQALLHYPWPGNVRELAHVMERAAFSAHLSESREITEKQLNLPNQQKIRGQLVSLKDVEKDHVQNVLQQFGGNRKKSAEVLNISERHLYRLIKSFSN